jgi:hypothetical protein
LTLPISLRKRGNEETVRNAKKEPEERRDKKKNIMKGKNTRDRDKLEKVNKQIENKMK